MVWLMSMGMLVLTMAVQIDSKSLYIDSVLFCVVDP